MLGNPFRKEREAYLLADVAAAHDAGIPVPEILNGPATASMPGTAGADVQDLTSGLIEKGLQLAPHERLMLETAESAGNVSHTLRILAEQRGQQTRQTREVRRMLVYPVFLSVFGFAVSLLAASVTGTSVWIPLIVFGSLLLAIYVVLHVVLRSTQRSDGGRFPLLSSVVLDYGELPYLHSMHGLYSAGVTITEAHAAALRTVPVVGVRMRLFQAGQRLGGDAGFVDALDEADALQFETRQMLRPAEAAGDLEEGLARAITRRQAAFDRNTRMLLRIGIVVIMVLVYGFAAWVIFRFYSNLYANLR